MFWTHFLVMRSAKPPAHFSLVTSIICSWLWTCTSMFYNIWKYRAGHNNYHILGGTLGQVWRCQGFVDVAHHMGPVLGRKQLLISQRYILHIFTSEHIPFPKMKCALSAVVTNAPIRLNASKDPNMIWIFNEPKAVFSFLCHSQYPWGRIECFKGAPVD